MQSLYHLRAALYITRVSTKELWPPATAYITSAGYWYPTARLLTYQPQHEWNWWINGNQCGLTASLPHVRQTPIVWKRVGEKQWLICTRRPPNTSNNIIMSYQREDIISPYAQCVCLRCFWSPPAVHPASAVQARLFLSRVGWNNGKLLMTKVFQGRTSNYFICECRRITWRLK